MNYLVESIYGKYWLNWLNERNFTTLYVDENYENFTRLYNVKVNIKLTKNTKLN